MKKFTEEELDVISDKIYDQVKAQADEVGASQEVMAYADVAINVVRRFIAEIQKEED